MEIYERNDWEFVWTSNSLSKEKISNTEERVNLAAKKNIGSNSKRMNVTWKYITYFMNDYSLDDILHLHSSITQNLTLLFSPSRDILKLESDAFMEDELSNISVNRIKYKGTQYNIQ